MSYLINLDMTYDSAISLLKTKYGPVPQPYFTESSYQNFFAGVIYEPVRSSGISRTRDGLYVHHVLESEMPLLSTPEFLQEKQLSFDFQNSENLVYVNLLEHFILHIIIGRESNGEFGYSGAYAFIGPELISWFYDKNTPTINWKMHCYDAVAQSGYDVFGILEAGYRQMGFEIVV